MTNEFEEIVTSHPDDPYNTEGIQTVHLPGETDPRPTAALLPPASHVLQQEVNRYIVVAHHIPEGSKVEPGDNAVDTTGVENP